MNDLSRIMCVTNKSLCVGDFLTRIEKIAKENVYGIILREKTLTEDEYYDLARKVLDICNKHNVDCYLHSFFDVAVKTNAKNLHMPLHMLRQMKDEDKRSFKRLGASVHSLEEAKEAQSLGCTYIIAGHIYKTDCKKDLEPRGIDFLKEIVRNVDIPVYAIGGINESNINQTLEVAQKVCIMSGLMKSENFFKR